MNYTRNGKFSQKRGVSVGVFPLTEAMILSSGGAHVANLPSNILVTRSTVIVKTASGTASSSVSVKVGNTVVHANAAVTAATVVTSNTGHALPAGGAVTVSPGATAPATGALECTLVLEYVELDKTNGELTAV